jgi:hypothetical protein
MLVLLALDAFMFVRFLEEELPALAISDTVGVYRGNRGRVTIRTM